MQRRVLIRTRGLASFRRALVDIATAGGPLAARRRVVVVPSRAAGSLLRLTIEQHFQAQGAGAVLTPDLLTRDEWLVRLLSALPGSPRWLGRIERLVLFTRAIDETLRRRPALARPFELRPGLVAAMLDFYDELRRRKRKVRSFARTIFDELRVERGTDRGSEELIDQTRFLGFSFLAYERAARAAGVDEHELVRRLLDVQPALPFDELVLAVADHPADPRGLWPADFDLIGRMSTLHHLHVVMTDEAHDAGFRARLEQELPGIEEVRASDVARSPTIVSPAPPSKADPGALVDVRRDREEELRQVARQVRARLVAGSDDAMAATTAVVFHRPLPYLYLAQQVLTDARVPYQAFDTLPLAAEPYAALLDLALAVVRTGGGREAVLALLRCPLAAVADVTATDIEDFGVLLTERRAADAATGFEAEVTAWAAGADHRAARATRLTRVARAAAALATEVCAASDAPTGSGQVRRLAAFLRNVERIPSADDAESDRAGRARAAVFAVLDALADAFERHDDRPRPLDDLSAIIYHAVEGQTFAPTRGAGGVHLVDAAAARFGEFDDVFLVGLVETDWAERQRRNFFYSAGLLKALGWPQDADQTLAQQAAFRDVLTLARHRTRLSAFQLDGEAVVALSTMIEAAADLPVITEPPADVGPLFADEVLTLDAAVTGAVTDDWLGARRARPPLDSPPYAGDVAPSPAEVYRVSRVDRYVTCPFKYFAAHVLRLTEERPESAGLTPPERGTFLHLLFERFFSRWQAEGHGAITSVNLPVAQTVFRSVADAMFDDLPLADRVIERMRIVGSLVAPGVADRVFELEAAAGAPVASRQMEVPIEGPFQFPVSAGLSTRTISIKGVADRVDLLGDGSIRVVDYKLGRMPDLSSSVQVAVYAHCARQAVEAIDGQSHPVSAAMYLAFGDERRLDGRLGATPAETSMAVETRAAEFAAVVERIESGQFPPRPLRPSECQWCGFAGVCRKEYRIEDDGAADAV